MSADLGIGTTFDCFQIWRKHPRGMDMLVVMEGAMLWAVPFSIQPEFLSGPLDLETSIFCSIGVWFPLLYIGYSQGIHQILWICDSHGELVGAVLCWNIVRKIYWACLPCRYHCVQRNHYETVLEWCSAPSIGISCIVFQNCFLSAVLSLLKKNLFSIAEQCISLVSCSLVLSYVPLEHLLSVQVVCFRIAWSRFFDNHEDFVFLAGFLLVCSHS